MWKHEPASPAKSMVLHATTRHTPARRLPAHWKLAELSPLFSDRRRTSLLYLGINSFPDPQRPAPGHSRISTSLWKGFVTVTGRRRQCHYVRDLMDSSYLWFLVHRCRFQGICTGPDRDSSLSPRLYLYWSSSSPPIDLLGFPSIGLIDVPLPVSSVLHLSISLFGTLSVSLVYHL